MNFATNSTLKSSWYWPDIAALSNVDKDAGVCGPTDGTQMRADFGAVQVVATLSGFTDQLGGTHPLRDFDVQIDGVSRFSLQGLKKPFLDAWHLGPKDFTGNGLADLVVLDRALDGECCHKYYVIQVEGDVGLVGQFSSGPSISQFMELDDEPGFEVMFRDQTFAYWHTDLKHSPMLVVFLKFDAQTGTFRMAPDVKKQFEWNQETAAAEGAKLFLHILEPPIVWGDAGHDLRRPVGPGMRIL